MANIYTNLALAGFFCMAPGLVSGQGAKAPADVVKIDYTKVEKKALRVEMIEMDITIRTISSMISLNKPDRLELLFKRLSELQTSSSEYHKKGIAGVVKKWKNNGLVKYLEAIQKESSEIAEKLHVANTGGKKEETPWRTLLETQTRILENCQGCHKSLGVEMQ